jgi:hypothetical protein
LLNIIIALISNVFTEVEQNGQRAFWLKRLRFISELQSLNVVLQRFLPIKQVVNLGDEEDDGNAQAAPLISKGEVEGASSIVKEEDESKDDADELDNTSANDNKSFSINLERISLTQGKSIGNWGQSQNDKETDFIYWYKWGHKWGFLFLWRKPPLLWRLVAFLKIAKWDEIYVPSLAFRKVLVGVPQEIDIEGFHKKLLGWIGSSMFCLFVIIPLTPIVLVLGLFTGGYFWSKEMKVKLFFGEIEAPLEKVEDEDENEGTSKDSSSQEELQEIKEELYKRTQEEHKTTKEELKTIKEEHKTTQEEHKTNQEKLMTTQEELNEKNSEIIALLKNNK